MEVDPPLLVLVLYFVHQCVVWLCFAHRESTCAAIAGECRVAHAHALALHHILHRACHVLVLHHMGAWLPP